MKQWFIFISFFVGLLGLGQEIVWVKLISFLGKSVPQAFSFVLFVYVLGIAIGAYKGSKLLNSRLQPKNIIAMLLLYSSLAAFISPLIISWSSGKPFSIISLSILILWGAALKGAIFPLLHHWCSQPGKQLGSTLSNVYFANVIGASLGPLLIGFWLLDLVPIIELIVYIGIIEFILALLLLNKAIIKIDAYKFITIGLIGGLSVLYSPQVMHNIIGKNFDSASIVSNIIENKHGIIYTVLNSEKNINQIYGGGVYDGAFNVNLTNDVNRIKRAYMLPLLHKNPKNVLFIGLSSGSWLRVVASIPEISHIDVVEINPGYMGIVRKHSGSDILQDPRINFIYGDGRQVVKEAINLGKKYDLIVMNTTWHWRAYTTNLLSINFFNMVKQVSKPTSVFAFNSTSSRDVFYTASQAFKFSYIFGNFIYSSDTNLKIEKSNNFKRICLLKPEFIDGQNCAQKDFIKTAENMMTMPFIQWQDMKYTGRKPEIVTDDNMIIEFKYGNPLIL